MPENWLFLPYKIHMIMLYYQVHDTRKGTALRTTTRHPICARLSRLISPYDHGLKFRGRVLHANRNERVVRDLNARGWVHRMTAADMRQHFAGEMTRYYTADGRVRTPETLVMIDVDCHKVGTSEAAVAFAAHLRDHYFPALYFEPSTNGNGVHAYLVLDKRGFGDERTHSLFGMLDRALKAIHADWQARNPGLVVELVEVKGHPPRIDWSREGKVVDYTAGQLAKLPREVDRRWEEFRQTTRIDERRVGDLHRRWKERAATGKHEVAVKPKSGSISGHVVDQEAVERFDDYLGLAGRLLLAPLRTSGREVATAEDLAVLLLILEACTMRMNADGSMPTARVMKNWDLLYRDDAVPRPFNHKRYAAMRDYLSREGLLTWEDEAYLPHQFNPGGKGRAARWRASERLMEMIEEAKEGGEIEGEIREQNDVIREISDVDPELGGIERREHLYGDSHNLYLLKLHEVGPFEGNDSSRTRDLICKVEEEDPFGGNPTLRLRELRFLRYPRPVLRISPSWRMAA